MFTYECEFHVPNEFGEIGALLVENELHKERYIKKIVLDLGDCNLIFTCKSWVHSKRENPSKRIFFTDKSYLPSETPLGLKSLREKDLESLRGNGEGTRKSFERIYDYDMYNDLGEPDKASDLARPMLGGEKHPYPRRCRTGRDMTTKEAESRKKLGYFGQFYVPRDEAFSDRKFATFGTMQVLLSIAEAFRPSGENSSSTELKESWFEKVVEYLVDKWADLNHLGQVIKLVVPKLLKDLYNNAQNVQHIYNAQSKQGIYMRENHTLGFEMRNFVDKRLLVSIRIAYDWSRYEWPLMSKLDPEVYGPPESAITKKNVEKEINRHNIQGFITFEEAFEQKKLFMLDYHDLLLPYVHTIRKIEGTTLYGSRTLMFLTSNGTLTPVAIELTCPPNDGKPQWKHVYTPSSSYTDTTTEAWLWKLAKTHVLAHDSGYHQLISHWLRTHCATEPYIIATHRYLSKMHPIHGLLSPHLRYTMQINALARKSLINAGGIIESTFSPGKYSMLLSSDVYAQRWRFDREALPADLISRGMAIEDPSVKHGVKLKLTIEDYPFANDGLALWYAIEQWATAYVDHYYPKADLVESDEELQAWWTEIRTVGHGDKKGEPWWPQLKTQKDLIGVVTTIMWVASGHHSAVNFGQYTGGYLPFRPTIARTKMPNEDPTTKEWDAFVKNPEHALKNCFPSISQSVQVRSTLNLLSSHSPDEEYLGVDMEAAWEAEPAIKAAFHKFSDTLNDLEKSIDSWNKNPNLKNRVGAGKVPYPYELLKPKSEAGVTGKGVPCSISI
ncbi:hypothetical protein OSB04_010046 [Centaurea solstitialis]|uniref:Lipoxygenase n=1 Tax=Centaurea solstitialis TaxID=347529 RepID=A0AA38TPV9_9ASTR|nr:hypothetical protein OSB04_010046 [Centaurea solstitialis]